MMGHKLMNCPRFGKMQNMFKDIGGKTTKPKLIIETKVVTWLMLMLPFEVRKVKKCVQRSKTKEEQIYG
jgi:hypothetical protein